MARLERIASVLGVSDSVLYTTSSRRGFLELAAALGGLALVGLTACDLVLTEPSKTRLIRREIGTWKQEEVEFLAGEMTKEASLPEVALAGRVLLDNQQGRASLSTMASFFSDSKISISTVDRIRTRNGITVNAPASTVVVENPQRIDVTMRSNADNTQRTLPMPSSLILKEIKLDSSLTKNLSDFMLKFYTTKEVYTVKSFDLFSELIVNQALSQYKVLTEGPDARKALRAYVLNGDIGGAPNHMVADLWGHFIMLPVYHSALDQGKFTKEEANSDGLRMFKLASEALKGEGVLINNQQGEYRWIEDSGKLYNAWLDLAINIFYGLQSNPPKRS